MKTDIVVIGGGMVGLAAALRCAQLGFQVVVVEAVSPQPVSLESYGLRVSAISLASQRLFQDLGSWEAMSDLRVSPYQNMVVWDAHSTGEITLTAQEAHVTHLGHIIENAVIQQALWQQAEQHDTITLLSPTKWTQLQRDAEAWHLILDTGESISAHLVIAADGARSAVREHVGIATDATFYQQHGVVCVLKTEQPHQHTAWQRFLATGPIAFLPLGGPHYCSMVWSTESAEAEHLLGIDETTFNAEVAGAIQNRLGVCEVVGQRVRFPLQHQHAETYVKEGLVLVGDAAHSIHPLAGQGVNLGFKDVVALGEVLAKHQQTGRPFYWQSSLQPYETARRGDNALMRKSMTLFNSVFSNESLLLSRLRGKVLSTADQWQGLKQFLMRHALGE